MLTIDPFLISFILTVLIALVIGGVFHWLRQPVIVGYIIAGILVGEHSLGIISQTEIIHQLGDLGILLLLFFIGTKIVFKDFKHNWKIPIIGTLIQVGISVLAMWVLGLFFDWSREMVIFFGFVISLSSTSVVIKILESKKLLGLPIGYNILGVLLVQDLLIVPMLILLSAMASAPEIDQIARQGIGMFLIIAFLVWLIPKQKVPFPFRRSIKSNHELQLLAAIIVCFGFAIIVGMFQLSLAFGAFLAGIYIAKTDEAQWIRQHLQSFVTFLMALFFIYIGSLIDPQFIAANAFMILSIVISVLLVNTFINGAIFKFLGENWQNSLYAGALLAQIGEFSFFLASIGHNNDFIEETDYQIIVPVIALTLLIGPIWAAPFENAREKLVLLQQRSKKLAKVAKKLP